MSVDPALVRERFELNVSWLENWSEAAARDVSPRYSVMNRVWNAMGERDRARIEKRWAR